MGVKLGYRITMRPKNKQAKKYIRRAIIFKSYRDENGNQKFVPYKIYEIGNKDVNSQESE